MSLDREDSRIFTLSVVEPKLFIDSLFPLGIIFQDDRFSLEDFLDFLQVKKHELFKSGSTVATNWEQWDIFETMTHPNQEDAVKDFIQNIAQSAEKRQLTNETVPPICRSWSSANKNHPARGGDVNRKPDLVCTDPIGVSDDWRHFRALVEIKSGELTPRSVYLLLQERAAVIFRHQDRRRFVLTFALIKHEMIIALFDRGGSVISPPFNIIDRPLLFLKVVLGLSFAPEEYLGYDTTIITRPSFRIINSRFLGRVTIHCTLFLADRMDGRGTVVWLAVLEGDALTAALPKLIQSYFHWSSPSRHMSLPLVVKDAWIDEKNS
ncbi:hypothetical protein JVT61DRAFT_3581, partial [Boletus reticuloceps]